MLRILLSHIGVQEKILTRLLQARFLLWCFAELCTVATFLLHGRHAPGCAVFGQKAFRILLFINFGLRIVHCKLLQACLDSANRTC